MHKTDRLQGVLTDDDKKRILEEHGPGNVQMRYCRLCGFMRWASTYGKEPDDVTLIDFDNHGINSMCDRCIEVFQRAPEVCEFVAGVILAHIDQ